MVAQLLLAEMTFGRMRPARQVCVLHTLKMLARRKSQPAQAVTVVGYILPRRNDEDEDEEGEEAGTEQDEPEFLDMQEMVSVSAGGFHLRGVAPKRGQVNFFNVKSGKECKAEGVFSLLDPWWEVTGTGRFCRNRLVLQGPLFYRLRTDLGETGRALVALFLKACTVHSDHVDMFMEWLRQGRDVGFANLLQLLDKFWEEKTECTMYEEEINPIKRRIFDSVAGKRMLAAASYPLVVKYLPTLLPQHFLELLQRGREPVSHKHQDKLQESLSLLSSLEDMIHTDVWKLGFSSILYKELRLVRCEACLKSVEACGLFQSIPDLQRNALQVYDNLKKICRGSGSTYEELSKLKGKMADVDFWDAILFLKQQGLVVQEKQRVALKNLYTYETGIANCLSHLMTVEPWHINLDVKEVLRKAQEERAKHKAKGGYGADESDEGVSALGSLVSQCSLEGQGLHVDAINGQDVVPSPTADNQVNAGLVNDQRTCNSIHVETAQFESCHTHGIPVSTHHKMSSSQPNPASSHKNSDADHAETMDGPTSPESCPTEVELDPDQVQAAEMICANPVTVISGKGGCGKTTVVSLIFRAAMEKEIPIRTEVENACRDFENDTGGSQEWDVPVSVPYQGQNGKEDNEKMEILLTAPTGRAAALLTRRTNFKAFTLHQVLWSFMKAEKDEHGVPKKWKFSSVRVFVVDEGSLVSVHILSSILSMLTKFSQLQKFIILGDVRQLPSIEPGNTLSDMFSCLLQVRWAIEMKTNHRSESELIVQNAGKISDMGSCRQYRPLDFDAVMDMNAPFTIPTPDKRFILVILKHTDSLYFDELQEAVTMLLNTGPGLESDKTSQFIAFRRNDCRLINDLCCQHYSCHTTRNHKKRQVFQLNDKVCCTRNGYVSDRMEERDLGRLSGKEDDVEEKSEKNDKQRLCNGEIFFVTNDVTVVQGGTQQSIRRYLTLNDQMGHEITVCFKELQKECQLQHAWARTIHTFQGSEAETIVYVLGNETGQNWRHVYTAVTRGQKRVYVVARKDGLKKAIENQDVKRKTWLGALLKMAIAKRRAEATEMTIPSKADIAQHGLFTPSGGAVSGFGSSQYTPSPSSQCSPRVRQTFSTPCATQTPKNDDYGMEFETSGHFTTTLSDDGYAKHHGNETDAEPSGCSHVNGIKNLFENEENVLESPEGSKRLSTNDHYNTPSKRLRNDPMDPPNSSAHLKKLHFQGRRLFHSSTAQK